MKEECLSFHMLFFDLCEKDVEVGVDDDFFGVEIDTVRNALVVDEQVSVQFIALALLLALLLLIFALLSCHLTIEPVNRLYIDCETNHNQSCKEIIKENGDKLCECVQCLFTSVVTYVISRKTG